MSPKDKEEPNINESTCKGHYTGNMDLIIQLEKIVKIIEENI